MEYVLLAVLLVAALVIVVAVLFQKSDEGGLSSALTGGSETYYGKDKSVQKNKKLGKWVLIVSIIFALAVLVVYVIQPDYHQSKYALDAWQDASDFANIFK